MMCCCSLLLRRQRLVPCLLFLLLITPGNARLDNYNVRNPVLDTLHTHQFYIHGRWVDPTSTSTHRINVTDPSNGQILTTLAVADATNVDEAVTAAQAALQPWSTDWTAVQRAHRLHLWADSIAEHQDELAWLLSREVGVPIDRALHIQVPAGWDRFHDTLGAARHFDVVRVLDTPPHEEEKEKGEHRHNHKTNLVLQQPVGVVALLTSWHEPVLEALAQLSSALLVGCTVVWKPSSRAPLTALFLMDLLHQADIPPGVVNLISGDGSRTGTWLTQHRGLDLIALVGSVPTGRHVVQEATAMGQTRVHWKGGGGPAPLIVFEDGVHREDDENKEEQEEETEDHRPYLENVFSTAILTLLSNSGQSRDAPRWWIVERPLYDRAVKYAKDWIHWQPVDSAHFTGQLHMGPVANKELYDLHQKLVRRALDDGAVRLSGGTGPEEETHPFGFYAKPTVLGNCTVHMDVLRKDYCGPLICITPFDTTEEAIQLVNTVAKGYPGATMNFVATSDEDRFERLVQHLPGGRVATYPTYANLEQPVSDHAQALENLASFCQPRVIQGLSQKRLRRFLREEDPEGDHPDFPIISVPLLAVDPYYYDYDHENTGNEDHTRGTSRKKSANYVRPPSANLKDNMLQTEESTEFEEMEEEL